MVYKNMQYSAWLDNAYNQNTVQGDDATCEQLRMVEVDQGGVKVTRPEYEVVVDYMANLQRAGSNNFTVGLLPKNAVPETAGSADSCITGLSDSAAHVILLLNENFNASTLAHEIGHEFGLAVTTGAGCTDKHNNDGRAIEGFRVLSGKNKSFIEGNGEYANTNIADCDKVAYATPVVPVMYQSAQDPKFRWMRKDDYESLLGKFTGASDEPLRDEGEAASGDWMVVQGYVDSSGTLTYVQPLYRITQRNISAPTGTGYTARLYTGDNGTGTSLGSYPFGTSQYTINLPNGQMVTTDSNMFIFSIPYVDTARSLVLTGPKNTLTVNKSTLGTTTPLSILQTPRKALRSAETSPLHGVALMTVVLSITGSNTVPTE